jgi:DNA end-binding protein Ku
MKILRTPLGALSAGIGIATGLAALGSRYLNDERPREQLEGLTKAELYERARAANIPGRSEMTKDELVRALRSAA